MWRAGCSLLVLLWQCQGQAVEITWSQWQALQAESLSSSSSQVQFKSETSDELSAFVGALPESPAAPQAILQVSRYIKALSGKPLNRETVQQLMQWRQSSAVLQIPSQEHPNQLLTLVNIGNEANTLLQAHETEQQAADYAKLWREGGFTPADFATFSGRSGQVLFLAFLNRLDGPERLAFASWVKQQFSDQTFNPEGRLNFVLARLARVNLDLALATLLVQQPVNEHSYQFLQVDSRYFPEQAQQQLLMQASEHGALRSLSYNLLAKGFADDIRVSAFIAEALSQPERYWMALSVMPQFVAAGTQQRFHAQLGKLSPKQQQQVLARLNGAEQE